MTFIPQLWQQQQGRALCRIASQPKPASKSLKLREALPLYSNGLAHFSTLHFHDTLLKKTQVLLKVATTIYAGERPKHLFWFRSNTETKNPTWLIPLANTVTNNETTFQGENLFRNIEMIWLQYGVFFNKKRP